MTDILLVEDNPHNRAVFQTALTARGYTIHIAEDGQRALDMVEAMVPDLMILDLSLPKVDGWTVAKLVRQHTDPARASVPILALTAHAMKGDKERALESGCDGYLSKPVSPRELARTVGEMLEQRVKGAG